MINCLYFNARSLINKLDFFEAIVNVLNVDVIGVTESWATPQILDSELSLPGFHMFRNDRKSDNRGGGVLLYVHEKFKPVEFTPVTSFQDNVWCQIGDLFIGVCYRSANYAIVGDDNDDKLLQMIRNTSNKNVILMGDFNYPEIDWLSQSVDSSAHNDCKMFLDVVEDCFLTQHVLEYTRDNATLDLILTREPDLVSDITIGDNFSSSDHNMITFKIHYSSPRITMKSAMRNYQKGDYNSIRCHLSNIDWDSCMSGSADECWTTLKDLLLYLEEKFVPVKTGHCKRKPIWMTNRAFKSVRKKLKTFSKYKDKNHPAVKYANAKAKTELKKARRSFEKKLARNIKQDRKSFYAYARSKSKTKVQITSLTDNTGAHTCSDLDTSELLNTYFGSVFTQEDVHTLPIPEKVFTDSCHSYLSDVTITLQDVMKQLDKLRSDKAAGADELSPRLLMEVKDEICYPLLTIFKKSLNETCIPDDWKSANITPIYKKGSRALAENYRPVSLTSQTSKMFEAILRDAIVEHLEKNVLITDSQHGFRKGRSCLTNLLTFLEKVTGYIDCGSHVDAIFLDFAKAFDKVPHQRLASKLLCHGITGKVYDWIVEWLKGRHQRVCLRGSLSDWLKVLSGVPQGSVLGPILFLIFINDLDFSIKSHILKFADDTKIFRSITSTADYNELQEDINNLIRWSEDWQMLFNVDKCKVMHFGRSNETLDYYMNGSKLDKVTEEKDLGVWISRDLKVSQQCIQACAKANRMLGVLNRTIKCKDEGNLIRFYKSLVRPHLEFCTAAWSPHYAKDKLLIEKVQRRFTRMIPRLKNTPYGNRLKELKLWSLEDRRTRADLIDVFKITHGLSSLSLDIFFVLDTESRTRGHPWKLKKRRINTDLRQHFFSERIINCWNKLDSATVCVTTVNSFKDRLQRLWMKDEFVFGHQLN